MSTDPPNQPQKPVKPDLKVIDDETGAAIPRLEKPSSPSSSTPSNAEKAPPKKRARLRREDRLPTATREEMMVPREASDGIDLSEKSKPLKFPPALIILVVTIFIALLGFGVSLVIQSNSGDAFDEVELEIQDRKAEQEEEAIVAQKLLANIKKTIVGYSSATTIEERLPYVRHPERVRPLMERYYRDRPFDTLREVSLFEQFPIPLGNRSFTVLTIVDEDSKEKIHLAEVEDDLQIKIDWESDVCYQPESVPDVIANKKTEPFYIRVFAIPDTLYAYEFADSEKYQCLKLTFRDSDDYLFGYIEKGSEPYQELFNYFRLINSRGPIYPSPMLLKVHFLPEGKGDNLVLIDEFVAPRWAFVKNPADE